jgi:hypothetical protein
MIKKIIGTIFCLLLFHSFTFAMENNNVLPTGAVPQLQTESIGKKATTATLVTLALAASAALSLYFCEPSPLFKVSPGTIAAAFNISLCDLVRNSFHFH